MRGKCPLKKKKNTLFFKKWVDPEIRNNSRIGGIYTLLVFTTSFIEQTMISSVFICLLADRHYCG